MDAELWGTIRRLYEIEKLSKSAIARRLGIHRWTVRKALKDSRCNVVRKVRETKVVSKLAPHKGYLGERLKDYPQLSGVKLLDEIRKLGYSGGYSILKKYLRSVRDDKPEVFLRLETTPGEFAQVDWMDVGGIQIGNAKRKVSCFVMVLSYCRIMYVEFTLSQCLEDFLSCHVHAFKYFGGVVKKINYDNVKTVVLCRVGDKVQFHSRFEDFAGYYLFSPVLCGIGQAHEKGKVESGIRYVRSSFLAGREILSFAQLQEDAKQWLDEIANLRVHGTTKERPIDRFELEKSHLQPLPNRDYDCSIIRSVCSTSQCLVHFDSNRYSVPFRFGRKTLTLKATSQSVLIYDGVRLIATHPRCYEKYRVIEDLAHYEGLLAERKRARYTKLVEELLSLSVECKEYLDGLVGQELHLQGHLEKIHEFVRLYGRQDVICAIRQALKFKAFGASYIQNIILQERAAKNMPSPQPIVLLKKPGWTKLTVEETNLSLYDEIFEPLKKEANQHEENGS